MSDIISQTASDFASYQQDVTDALAGLSAQVTDLTNKLANVTLPADASAALTKLDGSIKMADAALKAPPQTPPAP